MKFSWKSNLMLLPVACLVSLPLASAAHAKSSEWEISTTMEIPGMPFAMPPNTFRHCMDDQGVPYQQSEDEKCETLSKKVSGNTVSWKIRCQGKEGASEMNGVTTYSGNTMESKVSMRSDEGDVSMHMTGKKLGPCK